MRHLRPHCSNCVYWMPDSTISPPTTGHCHRNPPTGVFNNPTSGTIVQKFPTTDHHHWCGEWSGDDGQLVAAAYHHGANRLTIARTKKSGPERPLAVLMT